MKKFLTFVLSILLVLGFVACEKTPAAEVTQTQIQEGQLPGASAEVSEIYLDSSYSTQERVADLLSKMSLADKAGQMVQGEQYPISEQDMAELGLGSVLSGGGSVPDNINTVEHWNQEINAFQQAVLSRNLKIPFLYGADAVHGHNTVYGAVIFPHNIGIGAANDPELTQQMGAYVAEEMKLTGILWNFAPCVAVVQDPRWGRTYESFSSDTDIVSELASAYAKGQMEGGVLPCAKHFVADGGTTFGTGEGDYLIDRGDAQITAAINAGVDMLMEPYRYKEAVMAIVSGVESGAIPQERVDDAVKRILTVKFDMGLFEDPYLDNASFGISELGGQEGRALAKKLVEKSQVLLKNDNDILPFKRGQKIYIMGPAADNVGTQCGGWTMSWQGLMDTDLTPGTTILQGMLDCADEYGLTIITDESKAAEADVVLMVLGEMPYAEYEGDTENLSITGDHALGSNGKAMEKAKALGKPVVTLLVAGRNVLIDEYIGDWDAAVMSYLPGTEGDGVISPLVGACEFTGKLPMPWYKAETDIGKENPDLLFELGYGLTY